VRCAWITLLAACAHATIPVAEPVGELEHRDDDTARDELAVNLIATLRSHPPFELVGPAVMVSDQMIAAPITLSRRQALPHIEAWTRMLRDQSRKPVSCGATDAQTFVCLQVADDGDRNLVLLFCRDTRWRLVRGIVTTDARVAKLVAANLAEVDDCAP
jgi:hypothetical protein